MTRRLNLATFVHSSKASPGQRSMGAQRSATNQRGFFTIWVLGLCMMVAFVGGLSYDLWHSFSDKRRLSALVDAAAVAAANEIDIDAFRNDSTIIRLNEAQASATAAAYLQDAQASEGIVLTDVSVTFDGNAVSVTASTPTELTLIRLLVPDEEDLKSTVTGVATPLSTAAAPAGAP